MRVRLKGVNSRTKRLADGSLKTYYWAWKGGPPLPGKPGSPEFVAAYNAAIAQEGRTADRRASLAAQPVSGERRVRAQDLGANPPRLRETDQANRTRLRRLPDQGARRQGGAGGVPRMARRTGADVAPASRLRLWHARPHPVMGAQARVDRRNPAPKAASSITARALTRCGPTRRSPGSSPCRAAGAAGDVAGDQHRPTPRRLRSLPGRPMTEGSSKSASRRPAPMSRFRCPTS